MPTKAQIEEENDELRKRLLAMEERIDGPLQADSEPRAEPQGRGCSPLALVLLLMFFMFIGSIVLAVGAAWYFTRGGDEATPAPDRPRTALVEQVERVVTGPEADKHSLYFAKAARGIGGRLETLYREDNPVYDQRSEAMALVGISQGFTTAVKDANLYSGLPGLIEGVVRDAFPKKDGEVLAGEMTEADKKAFVKAWYDLADAFEEASK